MLLAREPDALAIAQLVELTRLCAQDATEMLGGFITKRSRLALEAIDEESAAHRELVKLLLQFAHGFEDYVADNRKAFWAHLIDRVLGGVPIPRVCVAVEVDDVHGWNTAGEEGLIVVAYLRLV